MIWNDTKSLPIYFLCSFTPLVEYWSENTTFVKPWYPSVWFFESLLPFLSLQLHINRISKTLGENVCSFLHVFYRYWVTWGTAGQDIPIYFTDQLILISSYCTLTLAKTNMSHYKSSSDRKGYNDFKWVLNDFQSSYKKWDSMPEPI